MKSDRMATGLIASAIKRNRVLTLAVLLAMASANAAIKSDFNDFVFPGTAGGGWVGPWLHTAGIGAEIRTDNPIDAGSPHLRVDVATGADPRPSTRNVARQYQSGGDIDLTRPHTIRWKFRVPLTEAYFSSVFTNSNDSVHFFARNALRLGNRQDGQTSWHIVAAGAANSGAWAGRTFWIYDNVDGWGLFSGTNNLDSGVRMNAGHVYAFAVTVYPESRVYTVEIVDETGGATFASDAPHRFRSASVTPDSHTWLHWGVQANPSSEDLLFDLDSVSITLPPEPAVIRNLTRADGGLSFEIGTRDGFGYVVERTDALDSGEWTELATVPGTGAWELVSDPTPDTDRRFYRVRTVFWTPGGGGPGDGPFDPGEDGALFDGGWEYVMVDLEEPTFKDVEGITLAVWVKLNVNSGVQTFLNRGARGELFTLYLFNDHVRMLVEYGQTGQYRHASTAPPPVDTWVHYVGSYDGQTIRLYVNGEEVDATAAAGKIPVRDDSLFIGATSPLLNVVNGWLADVRIYNKAISPEEARALHRGPPPSIDAAEMPFSVADLELLKRTDFPPTDGEPEYPFANGILATTDGFRGIWYVNGSRADGLHKYSGGLGTYPQQHAPIAIHAEEVNKTFFTYGGTRKDRRRLLHMVSVYDHETGLVARPRILLDKHTTDAHDNPTIQIDGDGHIWIFSNAHGTGRPSYIHRSDEPWSIESFTRQVVTNFSYSQPWHLPDHNFVFLHTLYGGGRRLYVANSGDGVEWTEPRLLARIKNGHYQISWPRGNTIGTAFNYHPDSTSPLAGTGLNWRTNLYYMESDDGGQTWRNVQGEVLDLPLTEVVNPALAIQWENELKVIYMKSMQYTAEGHPVILYLTTPGWQSGPENDPRVFTISRWTGAEWKTMPVTTADNNYDYAALYIEDDGTWRIIGTTEVGPQEWNTGGEMAMWISHDEGETWTMVRQMTQNSEYNHTYPRKPLNAHPDFYAFWADGHGREISPSRLYFSNREGDVFRLPHEITGDELWVAPEAMP